MTLSSDAPRNSNKPIFSILYTSTAVARSRPGASATNPSAAATPVHGCGSAAPSWCTAQW